MFYRRLYFLFPDAAHARSVCDELIHAGIDEHNIHAVARPDIELGALPAATVKQRRNEAGHVEALAWNSNLVLFGIAAAAFVLSLFLSSLWLALAALLVMAATFLGGVWFAVRVPNVQLSEFREALAHGEVVLMVDVRPKRVADIEALVHRRHPEAAVGGVGWTVDGLGI